MHVLAKRHARTLHTVTYIFAWGRSIVDEETPKRKKTHMYNLAGFAKTKTARLGLYVVDDFGCVTD
jgi:hypothetical protein